MVSNELGGGAAGGGVRLCACGFWSSRRAKQRFEEILNSLRARRRIRDTFSQLRVSQWRFSTSGRIHPTPVTFGLDDGKFSFTDLGEEFRLKPESIKLNGTPLTGDSRSDWEKAKAVFKMVGLPLGATKDALVVVTGDPAVLTSPTGTRKPYKLQKLIGTLAESRNARVHSYCTMRVQTAKALCDLVNTRGALLIRAPLGSGKTSLLQLVVRVVTPDVFKNVYYISLADLGEKTFEELWNKTYPGVDIDKICSPTKNPESPSERPTLLLLDEGQAAFAKDLSLWRTLKGVAGGFKEHLRIIVVSVWGSNNVVEAVHFSTTRVEFTADNTISLLPTDSCPVAVQLREGEATELWAGWCHEGLADKLASADHLRDYIFHLTGKQPGLMTKVLDWLLEKGLRNAPACHMEEKARSWLLSSAFLDSLSSLRTLRTLPDALGDGKPDSGSKRSLVRKLLAEEYVYPGLLNESDKKAAGLAVKWGQIVEDQELGFSIPSQLHRQFLFCEVYCKNDLTFATNLKEGLVAFVR